MMKTLSPALQKELAAEVRAVLAEADADIAARRPVCRASGRCCRFEEYGHRLYVTAAEMLYFAEMQGLAGQGTRRETRDGETARRLPAEAPAANRTVSLPFFFSREPVRGCPYQVEGLCTARDGRPLGCRVYFCDENAQAWQNELYEKHHAKLQALHARFGLPYEYLEWRAGLRKLLEDGNVAE